MTHSSRSRRFAVAAALLAFVLAPCGAFADELRVASSGGFAAAFKALAPGFERESGVTLATVWGPSMGDTPQAIPQRLKAGEPLDVVIMVDDAAEALARDGLTDPRTKKVLANSLIAVAVKAGAARPDISTPEALRQALLRAKSIAYSVSASGVYLSTVLFPKLGVAEALKTTARMIPAEPVGQVVARGAAELGFQQLSELMPVKGIDIVGLIPSTVQQVTPFSAAIVANSRHVDAASALIRYLSSPAAADAIRASGLEPASAPAR